MATFDFVPDSTQYQAKNALFLARVAELTYHLDEAYVKRRLAAWGLPEVYPVDRDETQAIVASNDEAIIVAFRGTEPNRLKDLMTDLNLWLSPGPAGRVHRGFLRALNPVWDELLERIQACQGQTQQGGLTTGHGKSLWFTGHSLGGALATLAVAKLRLELDRGVFGLYTFGSPRVGDRDFSEAFNTVFGKYTYRFVHNNDTVTRVPLRRMRYSHVGSLVYIDQGGQLQSDIGWWWRFLDRIQGRIEDLLDEDKVPDGLADHIPQRYIDALTNQLDWMPG